jgi:bacterioferritin-associated ferredoxin
MAPLRITRCVCRGTTFASLLTVATERRWTLPDLVRETGCGAGCGLCLPYLREMLRTGRTEFSEVILE